MKNPKISKLELYVEILRSLAKQKLARLSDIEQQTSADNQSLRQAMTFLEKQNLVQKISAENGVIYKSTQRGERVTKYFSGPNQERCNYLIPDNTN